ncbi:oligosaccharide flippase family protein (plasmid) [Limimaricola variabilis]|uniref:lipopolysaccharide biosynthesis protein n=1 Tax=Limimaricola variabilis TaxID=1492771 RepID=UPI002AC9B234|nr:oligosaccharide flippase family protein [Limimaricola variabilis]WPY96234.1 oligosaccharide flippase family protein [Limimaricola variabilis]
MATDTFRRLITSPFLRNVSILSSGSAVSMAVPILAAPVLGRLYTPADYGALAQYMAPAAVLGVLACLQFQNAILAERTGRGASVAAWLGLLSALVTSVATALAVAALWVPVLAQSAPGAWFTLLPLSVAGAGLVATGQFLANRHRMYRQIALVQVAQVLTTVALSILLGLLDWGANGLLAAYALGQAVLIGAYARVLARLQPTLRWPRAARLRVLVRRHWKFPAFTLPAGFSSEINMQAPVFALTALGTDGTLGAFTRARQLVSLPMTMIGQSVAQVFRREASELYHETGSCRALMRRTAGWLLAAGLGPCLLFMAFAPWLFAVYLGPDWREAGEIARILAPMLLLRVIVSPLTTVFFFTDNQALDLKLMLGSAVLIALAISLGWAVIGTAMAVIWAFALGYGVVYLIYLISTFKVAGP